MVVDGRVGVLWCALLVSVVQCSACLGVIHAGRSASLADGMVAGILVGA